MKKIKLFILAFVSLVSLNSCIENEIESDVLNNTPFTLGFESASESYVFLPSNVDPVSSSTALFLSGGNGGTLSESDIVFTYEIDPSTTAIEGTDFRITNDTNSFVIPAGKLVADQKLNYEIYPDALNIGDNKTIVINLTPSTEGVVGAQQLVISLAKCDPPLIGRYTAANTVNGSSNGDGEGVVVTALGCNLYRASNLPNFNGVFTWDFILNDDNTIDITGVLDGVFTSNRLTGSGVLLDNGTIRINKMNVANTSTGIDMSFDLIPN